MNRTNNSECLLCKSKKATKTNSHIVPKFMGKSMLGNKGPGKGYVIDSSKPHSSPRIIQDSPKENYVLCSNCEKYFEVLETYVAEHLSKRILNKRYENCFKYETSADGVEFAECTALNSLILRLFVLSLFWRCSISSIEPFSNFKIVEENKLREILNHFIGYDLKSILSREPLPEFFIVIIRAKDNHDKTANYLFANDANERLYQLIVNEYVFLFSLTFTDLQSFGFLINSDNQNFLIGLLKDQTWLNLRKEIINSVVTKSLET